MAEIRVERVDRKKGIPVWAIVLALVVLAVIVWAVVSMRNRGHQQDVDHRALMAPAHVLVLETHRFYGPRRRR
jgi:type VI protein secretion system component VasF